jgi:hypothetical protein
MNRAQVLKHLITIRRALHSGQVSASKVDAQRALELLTRELAPFLCLRTGELKHPEPETIEWIAVRKPHPEQTTLTPRPFHKSRRYQ